MGIRIVIVMPIFLVSSSSAARSSSRPLLKDQNRTATSLGRGWVPYDTFILHRFSFHTPPFLSSSSYLTSEPCHLCSINNSSSKVLGMEGTAVALLSAVGPFLLFTAGIVGGKAQDISAPVSAPIKNGLAID